MFEFLKDNKMIRQKHSNQEILVLLNSYQLPIMYKSCLVSVNEPTVSDQTKKTAKWNSS